MKKSVNWPDGVPQMRLNAPADMASLSDARQFLRIAIDEAGYKEIGTSFGPGTADVQFELPDGRQMIAEIRFVK